MQNEKLFNINFTFLLLGQSISLFANAILRFAISLYVLELTKSAAVFGSIMAVSVIPLVLFSPFGGILADRVNRKYIMVALDAATALIVVIFALLLPLGQPLFLIAVVMILLSVLSSFETPTVESAVPLLSSKENLVKAHGAVSQIQSIANILGAVLGGFLYAELGLDVIMRLCVISFVLAAAIECFLKIPAEKREMQGNVVAVVISDFKEAVTFLTKEKPVILKIMLSVAAFNLFVTSMIIIGLPYIVEVTLGLNSRYLGFAQGIMFAGGIAGAILAGPVSEKVPLHKVNICLLACSLALLPMSIALGFAMPPIVAYVVMVLSIMAAMVISMVFSVIGLAYMQGETPNQLVGKVSAFIITLSLLAQPVGHALYGFLFDVLKNSVSIVVLIAILSGVAITVLTKPVYAALKMPETGEIAS